MKKTFLLALLLLGFFGPQKSSAQAYDPFIGQIIAVGFNYAPRGWAMCSGQILPIASNTALFSLLGTVYGGNGTSTFALPNLNGRAIVCAGSGPGLAPVNLGQSGGAGSAAFTLANLPAHTHPIKAYSGPGTANDPSGNVVANTQDNDQEYTTAANTTMSPTGVSGSGQPISTMQPYLGMYYVICLQGVYPEHP